MDTDKNFIKTMQGILQSHAERLGLKQVCENWDTGIKFDLNSGLNRAVTEQLFQGDDMTLFTGRGEATFKEGTKGTWLDVKWQAMIFKYDIRFWDGNQSMM